MRRIRYRNKIRLKKFSRFLLIALALSLVAGVAILVYADSLMVYDREGAHFASNAGISAEVTESVPAPTVVDPTIIVEEGAVAEATIAEMGGYYITTSMLRDIDSVITAIEAIEEPCAVMIELKSIWGNFYYSTDIVGAPTADADITAVDNLISYLNSKGFYTIASVPAFTDPAFALENQSCGLPLSSGVLWMDEYGCYWLDPANDTVISYLMQIARELAGRGFREVAFSDFRFPDTSSISYSSEKSEDTIIEEAASSLSAFFAGSSTKISFITSTTSFPTGSCTGRLYIPDVDGSKVELYANSYGTSETLTELVFLANSRDTRFEGHAQLRPLIAE